MPEAPAGKSRPVSKNPSDQRQPRFDPGQLLAQIVPHLDRSGVPGGKFPDAKGEYWAHCPFHRDGRPDNFSVSEAGYHCFSCGAKGGLTELAQKLNVRWHGGTVNGERPCAEYSLARYAQDKHLPEAFLRTLGLSDGKFGNAPALRIPYHDDRGRTVMVRYRIAAEGDKFRWSKGAKLMLYGLDRLDRTAGYVHLVEGESDTQTLWFCGEPALGVPGASTWKPEWAEHLKGLAVYVWQEPDEGGQAFARTIRASMPDARIMTPPEGRKDASDCYIHGDDMPALMKQLRESAVDGKTLQSEEIAAAAGEARRTAGDLLTAPDILDRFARLCGELGLVGEDRIARLLYLALTSRLLARPVSVVVKGPSSGGKSFTVATVLKAFPNSAYYALTGMTEKSLVYSEEPLVHRHLVLYEAAGMTSEFGAYLMRTLLSEGRIRYEFVESTNAGVKARFIEREGPTGLIVTTTEASLHPENETRMFSITVRDTSEQTRRVMDALADEAIGDVKQEPDVSQWHALQDWLALAGTREVVIPYAPELAHLIDPRAVRLRRDFRAVLNLIQAHAILQQESRAKDSAGISSRRSKTMRRPMKLRSTPFRRAYRPASSPRCGRRSRLSGHWTFRVGRRSHSSGSASTWASTNPLPGGAAKSRFARATWSTDRSGATSPRSWAPARTWLTTGPCCLHLRK